MKYSIYTRREKNSDWKLIYSDVDIEVLTGYIKRTCELRKYYSTELKIITITD